MGRNKVLFISAVVVVAVAALIALRADRSRPGCEAPAPSGSQPPAPSGKELRSAPDIDIVMYQGESVVGGSKITLSKLWRTGRPIVLNFWAGLCPPCRAEMPDFQRLYNERAQGKFILIGVDIGPFIGLGTREEGKALLKELKITFPTGTTFDARTIQNYEILGMPTTVFITPEGKILRKHTGLLTRGQMDAFTDELLRASTAR